MKTAGINVAVDGDGGVFITGTIFADPKTHEEIVMNGMIMTMRHEVKKIAEHYKKFTERKIVLNIEGESNEL
jgi:tartrate dehydratase beta subunit/fumarate hydratase class I family protein